MKAYSPRSSGRSCPLPLTHAARHTMRFPQADNAPTYNIPTGDNVMVNINLGERISVFAILVVCVLFLSSESTHTQHQCLCFSSTSLRTFAVMPKECQDRVHGE